MKMGEQIKTITYELLYDLLRAEKNSAKLQALNPSFYDDCNIYFNEKKNMLNKTENKFAQKDSELIQAQLRNVRIILNDLYSIRIKKILSLAIDKSKINTIIVDNTPMLRDEKELYENMLNQIEMHKKITVHKIFEPLTPIFNNTENGNRKVSEDISNNKMETRENPASKSVEKKSHPNEDIEEEIKDRKTVKMESKNSSEFQRIEFLQSISRFYDSELNPYGPFEAGNSAELPESIVQILMDKGAIKLLN